MHLISKEILHNLFIYVLKCFSNLYTKFILYLR
nr:MAG TPA: hypothetical protein [Caudoviricetes sp.]